MDERKQFNHAWPLIGRSKELKASVRSIVSTSSLATIIVGSAGVGKTRLLRDVVESSEVRQTFQDVFVLGERAETSDLQLSKMGQRKTLFVVDDAHDHEDLSTLARHVATRSGSDHLLLVTRSHGLATVQSALWNFSLLSNQGSIVLLEGLTKSATSELAAIALKQFGRGDSHAVALAEATRHCTLATVAGAYSVAHDNVQPPRLSTQRVFREQVLRRFADIVVTTPNLNVGSTVQVQVLRLVAILQPVGADARDVVDAMPKGAINNSVDVHQVLKALVDAGIVLNRRGRLRIVPDLVGDQLLSDACFGVGGKSTGFAEDILQQAPDHLVENIVKNVGKVHWLRSEAPNADSRLLDTLWKTATEKYEATFTGKNGLLNLAYFHPERAVAYAQEYIRRRQSADILPELLFNAAHNYRSIDDAVDSLWSLALIEKMTSTYRENSSLSKLAELVSVSTNKPIAFCAKTAERLASKLDQDDAWINGLSPYDALVGCLRSDGMDTVWTGRAFSIRHFSVRHRAVRSIRANAINRAIRQLADEKIERAWRAAVFLDDAFRPPFGRSADPSDRAERNAWQKEFLATLSTLGASLRTNAHDDLIMFRVAKTVAHLGKYSPTSTQEAARAVLTIQPEAMRYRISVALLDGFGHLHDEIDHTTRRYEWSNELASLAIDALDAYECIPELVTFISGVLTRYRKAAGSDAHSARPFLHELCGRSPEFVHALLQSEGETQRFVAVGLFALAKRDVNAAIEEAERLASHPDDSVVFEAASSLGYLFANADEGEIENRITPLAVRIINSATDSVATAAVDATRALKHRFPTKSAGLLLSINFAGRKKVADEVLSELCGDSTAFVEGLSSEALESIFAQLDGLPNLDSHYISTFISTASKHHPSETADFLMEYTEQCVSGEYSRLRAIGIGHYAQLQFRNSREHHSVRNKVWCWLKAMSARGYLQQYFAVELFSAMFRPYDNQYFEFLVSSAKADSEVVVLATKAYCEAGYLAVIDRPDDVSTLIALGERAGAEVMREVTRELYVAAAFGERHGTYGEPFPRDLETLERVETILRTLARSSNAWVLYKKIADNAQSEIDDQRIDDDEEHDAY